MNTKPPKTGYTLATQYNASMVKDFAFFSDTIRNLIKGGTYNGVTAGFISGGNASLDELNACFKGMPDWCPSPSQSINYISCHDNNTLYDHITMVAKGATEEDRIAMNKLGAAFYMTSQGIPFFQAGEEMLRTKPKGDGFDDNSYSAPDSVNSIKWDTLADEKYQDVVEYYQGLIQFRKTHAALRLTDAVAVNGAVQPQTGLPTGVAAYHIQGGQEGECSDAIFCAFNAGKTAATVTLPVGQWTICVNGEDAGVNSLGTATGTVELPSLSSVILVQGALTQSGSEQEMPATEPSTTQPPTTGDGPIKNEPQWSPTLMIPVIAVAVTALALGIVLTVKKKR
jgi:pullulanase